MSTIDKLTPVTAEDLRAEFITLHAKITDADKRASEIFAHRVPVEEELLRMAAGKLPLPDRDKCRELALKLGVPEPTELLAERAEHDALRTALADVWTISRHHVAHHTLGGEALVRRVDALLPEPAVEAISQTRRPA